MKREISFASYTDIGGRSVNEDSVGAFSCNGRLCFVLCDGLGGHGMGDTASSTVVSVFRDRLYKVDNSHQMLKEAFCASQDILLAKQKTLKADDKMKTTAVAVVIDDKDAYIGHIGDSRVYIFNKNKVVKRTMDHSIPQMLALSGDIKDGEIRNHPDRNIVLRVLGSEWDEPMYELMPSIPLKKCQAFLLCSDGFWELIGEEEMCYLLSTSRTVDEWLKSMASVVKGKHTEKSKDNNSAIAVWCG